MTETLEHSQRTDFCVGYFYLSGWKEVADKIENLIGGTVMGNLSGPIIISMFSMIKILMDIFMDMLSMKMNMLLRDIYRDTVSRKDLKMLTMSMDMLMDTMSMKEMVLNTDMKAYTLAK